MIPPAVDRFLLERLPPRLSMHYRSYQTWRWGDPEIKLLSYLCDRHRDSIDVGPFWGMYTYHMRRLSRRCIAVEPSPEARALLRQNIGKGVTVLPFALSCTSGKAFMRVPERSGKTETALGTIEDLNVFSGSPVKTFEVEVSTIDIIAPDNVGFIKIDVEGHELSVLRGAKRIIVRDRPNMIIELEERHRPGAIDSTIKFLFGYGYDCHFLFDGKLRPIVDFSLSEHQSLEATGKPYINNFIFTAGRRHKKLMERFS